MKITSGINTPSLPQDNFYPAISSGITFPISMGTNSKIPFSDIFLIPPRDLSKILEDTYADTFYKSTSSASTNSKIHLVDPDSTTSVKYNSDSTPNPIPPLTISNSNIRQQIWIHIFNEKPDPKDLNMYDGKEIHCCKAKENWAAAISEAQL